MALAHDQDLRDAFGVPRHDWTRDEVARAVFAAVPGTAVPCRPGAPREFRSRRGADLDAALDQDRRLPGRLRLLPAVGEIRHRRRRRKADEPRCRAGRGARGQAGRCAALLHGRRLALAQGPRSRRRLRHGGRRQGAGPGDLRHARHADRAIRRSGSKAPASITTITTSTPRRNITAPSSPRAPIRTGSTRSRMCARPAFTSAAAASSAWARGLTTASA